MNLQQIEITKNMTEVEQLNAKLNNWLFMDMLNEEYKEDDLEEYYEYLEEEKAPFESYGTIEQVNGIFYQVETNQGIKYFVVQAGFYDGIVEFEGVTEQEVLNIA